MPTSKGENPAMNSNADGMSDAARLAEAFKQLKDGHLWKHNMWTGSRFCSTCRNLEVMEAALETRQPSKDVEEIRAVQALPRYWNSDFTHETVELVKVLAILTSKSQAAPRETT